MCVYFLYFNTITFYDEENVPVRYKLGIYYYHYNLMSIVKPGKPLYARCPTISAPSRRIHYRLLTTTGSRLEHTRIRSAQRIKRINCGFMIIFAPKITRARYLNNDNW